MTRETVTTWIQARLDAKEDTLEGYCEERLPYPVTPPPPKGDGWRCVAMAATSVALFWTWEREVMS